MVTAARTDDVTHVDAEMHVEDSHEVVTGEAVALDLRSASFVLRAAGAMIDFVAYLVFYILFTIVVLTVASQAGLDDALTRSIQVAGLVLCIVAAPIAVETISHGKSLGKLAIGARIVRDDGGSIGFRHAFIRSLTGVLEIFMTFGGLAAIVGLLNSRAKRLGDLVAGTYSQNERVSRLNTPVYGVPVSLLEWARTADVAKMPDPLARRIAQFLAQASGFTPDTRERFARSLANEVSVFVSPIPATAAATDAEMFLAAVAALRRDRETAALSQSQAGLARLGSLLGGMPRGFPDRG